MKAGSERLAVLKAYGGNDVAEYSGTKKLQVVSESLLENSYFGIFLSLL